MRIAILFTFALVVIAQSAHSQLLDISDKHELTVRFDQTFMSSDRYYDADETIIPIRTNSIHISTVSAEYAASKRFIMFGSFPLFVRNTINELRYRQSGTKVSGVELNSFGDANAGFGYRVIQTKNMYSTLFFQFGFPLGKISGLGTDGDLQNGDGEFNQIIGFTQRLGSRVKGFFVAGNVLFNNRTEDYSNEIHYSFEGGWTNKRFGARVHYFSIESLFNNTAPVSLNGIFSNHREIRSIGCQFLLNTNDRLSFSVKADVPVSGRNTLAAVAYGVGIQFRSARRIRKHL